MASSSAWMRDMQNRMKKATVEVNTALQPRVVQLSRTLEEQMQNIGLRHGKELYDDDGPLLAAVTSLDELRDLLRSLSTVVESHRKNLLAVAASERALGELLSAPSSSLAAVIGQHVSDRHVETQVALGTAQVSAASSLSRFALDFSTPMSDLSRTFEETYRSKITPLKKLYASQKTEYVRYVRQAGAADAVEEGERRANLESIASSARAVWESTSQTLQAEIAALVAYFITNLTEWTMNVAQAEAETYARTARTLESPARQAELIQQE
jgi:hypothetical protein